MKLNDKKSILDAYSKAFNDNKFDVKSEARLIMYRFLSEVERVCENENINRKQLAQKIGTSASFITQLYQGSKTINLETIAKLQKALNIVFDIKVNDNQALVFKKNVEVIEVKRAINYQSYFIVDKSNAYLVPVKGGMFDKKAIDQKILIA
jgi:ribosome-binding protein aMBF1 (putative translation factor)